CSRHSAIGELFRRWRAQVRIVKAKKRASGLQYLPQKLKLAYRNKVHADCCRHNGERHFGKRSTESSRGGRPTGLVVCFSCPEYDVQLSFFLWRHYVFFFCLKF